MNRQCRICLDTDNPFLMTAPCNCRGSAEFIHRTCLEEYIRHFPDGVCRVCQTSMAFMDGYEIFSQIVTYCWLTGLLIMSQIPVHTKLVYLTMTLALLTFMGVRKMFSYAVIFIIFGLSAIMSVAYTSDAVKLVGIVGVLMAIATIGYYIPPQYVFLLAAIILSAIYATLLMLFIATHTDPYMTGFFVGFVGLCWYTCVRLRQPFN